MWCRAALNAWFIRYGGVRLRRCQPTVHRARYRLFDRGVTQLPRCQLNYRPPRQHARFMRRFAVLCAQLFL